MHNNLWAQTHFATVDPHPPIDPMVLIFLRVIERAISDLHSPKHRPTVIAWIETEDFDEVCDLAKVDHEVARATFRKAIEGRFKLTKRRQV